MATPWIRRLCVLLVCAAAVSVAPAKDVLRVRADAWMPFNGTPGEAPPGYVIEILNAIYQSRDIEVDYQNLAWEEALAAAKSGAIEAVIGANPAEGEGLLFPKKSIGAPRVALFVPKASTWEYKSLGSLRDVKLGVIAGYSYWDALDNWIKSHPGPNTVVLSGETPLLDGIKKLNAGEIDVMAESVPVFVWNVKAAGFSSGAYKTAFVFEGEPIFVAFADTSDGPRFLARFDPGIEELRKSGELKTILQKYGLPDWD